MGITEITIAVLPWLCAMLVFLGLITYVPEISLWLPRLFGMINSGPKLVRQSSDTQNLQ